MTGKAGMQVAYFQTITSIDTPSFEGGSITYLSEYLRIMCQA